MYNPAMIPDPGVLVALVAMVTAVGGQGTFHQVRVVPGTRLPVDMVPYKQRDTRYMEMCALMCVEDSINCRTITYNEMTQSCELLTALHDDILDPDILRYIEGGAMVMFLHTSQDTPDHRQSDIESSTTQPEESNPLGESTAFTADPGHTTEELGTIPIDLTDKLTAGSLTTTVPFVPTTTPALTTVLFVPTTTLALTTVPFVPTTTLALTTIPFVPPTTPTLATEGPTLWRAYGSGNTNIDCTFTSNIEFPEDRDKVEMPSGQCCASLETNGELRCHGTPWPCCKAERCVQPCECPARRTCYCSKDMTDNTDNRVICDRY